MGRSRGIVFCFLAWPPLAHAGQELDRSVLERLKSATVFVTSHETSVREGAAGFLFHRTQTNGRVITCRQAVGSATEVEIVFAGGTPSEQALTGKVVAADPDRDLACALLEGVRDLPAPLEIAPKTSVIETETVYAAGFPFGRRLADGRKNPAVSVWKSSVSCVRRDPEGQVASIQMDGDGNPGIGGGPVIDGRGAVVGLLRAPMTGPGPVMAVPPEEIRSFLQGRAGKPSFKPLSLSATAARFETTVDLIDPLGAIKEVELLWCPEEALDNPPEPGPDGTWGRIHPGAKVVPLKIAGAAATGAVEILRAPSAPRQIFLWGQAAWVGGDGMKHFTEPELLEAEFATPVGPAAQDLPLPPQGKAGEIPAPDELKTAGTLPLRAAIAELVLSPDGEYLYALDLSEGKVYQIRSGTLEISAQADVIETAVAMSLTPDGKTIYVGGRDPEPVKPEGSIQVISTATMQGTATFTVPYAIYRLAAANNGTIAATGFGKGGGLAIIQAGSRSLVATVSNLYAEGSLRLHPDQNRVYIGSRMISPGDFYCVSLRKNSKGQNEVYDSPYHGDYPLGGEFEISPDGRFLIGCAGTALRLGRTKESDLRFAAAISPAVSIALSKGSNTLILATSEGFLKFYELPAFELKKSVKVGLLCTRLILDSAKKRLYAVAVPLPPTSSPHYDPNRFAAGDIVGFSLESEK